MRARMHQHLALILLFLVNVCGPSETGIPTSNAALGFGQSFLDTPEPPVVEGQDPAATLELLDDVAFSSNSIFTDFSFTNSDELVVSKLDLDRYATIDGYPTSKLTVLQLPKVKIKNTWFVRECVTSVGVSCDLQWIATASIKNKPEQPTGEVQLWRNGGNKPSMRIDWEPRTVNVLCEYDSTGKRPLWITAQKLQFSQDSSTLFAYAPTLCEIDLTGQWDPSVRWLITHKDRRWWVDAAKDRIAISEGTSVRITDLHIKHEVCKVIYSYEREPFVTPSISDLNLTGNGRYLYSRAGHPFTGYLADIQVWDIERGEELFRKFVEAGTYFSEKEWIGVGTVHPGGKLVVYVVNSPCFGGEQLLDSVALELRVEDIATQKVVASHPLPRARVLKLAFSRSGQYLAVLLGSKQLDLFSQVPETRADWEELAKSSSLRLFQLRGKQPGEKSN
jgi:WD40 repeat protein